MAFYGCYFTIRNNLQLDADVSFDYQIICSCNPSITSLENPEVSIKVISYLTLPREVKELTDWITQDVRTEVALDIISQSKLSTSITDEMEAYYGLGRYDNRYLYYWDDYTIADMSAEIVNQT